MPRTLQKIVPTLRSRYFLNKIIMKKINIENYKLLERFPLCLNDTVAFDIKGTTYGYTVQSSYLSRSNETVVFDKLVEIGMISKDHTFNDFCAFYYGYEPKTDSTEIWPEATSGDYEALTRVVYGLFELIEEFNNNYSHPVTTINLINLTKISFL